MATEKRKVKKYVHKISKKIIRNRRREKRKKNNAPLSLLLVARF